jgi:coniferyl-aldehyde dehydrogenase
MQRAAYLRAPFPDAKARKEHLRALADMMLRGRGRIRAAMREDYGIHPDIFTDIAEVAAPVMRVQNALARLDEWMMPEARSVEGFGENVQALMVPHPKGVIGTMAPWNFPFELACGPLVDMLAAGNRVIMKPSEITAACSEVLEELVAKTFDRDHVSTAIGGVDLARFFPTLPWNHLLYTGSTEIGRHVMLAAAENLVPVTLELGGKAPAIFLESGLREKAIESVLSTKMIKSGQVCVSVDHVLTPRARLRDTVEMIRASYQSTAAGHAAGPDCAAVVSERHMARIQGMIDDAKQGGAEVISLEPEVSGAKPNERRMPLHLVVDPGPDLRVSREEIFGPILPIIPYDTTEEVIDRVQAGGRPLALYLFGTEQDKLEEMSRRMMSGGVTFNGAGHHAMIPSLGFGGSGASGMGMHHDVDGFREFSHLRGTFHADPEGGAMFHCPPYPLMKHEGVDAMIEGLERDFVQSR